MKRCPDPSPPPCSCHTSRADHGPPLVGAAQGSSQTAPSQCPQTYPQDHAHQGTAIKKYTDQHHKQTQVNAVKHTPRQITHIRGLQSRNTQINITNRPKSMPSNIPPGSRTSGDCNQEIHRSTSQTDPSQCPQTDPQDHAHQGTAIKKYTDQHHKQAQVNVLKHTPRITHIRGLQSRNTQINITNRPKSMPSNRPPGSRTSGDCNQEIHRSTSQTGPSQCPQTYPQDHAHQGTAIKKYTVQHHKLAQVNAVKQTPRITHIRGLQSRIYRSTSLACIVLWANFLNSLASSYSSPLRYKAKYQNNFW